MAPKSPVDASMRPCRCFSLLAEPVRLSSQALFRRDGGIAGTTYAANSRRINLW
jgi:hypothetical protein